MMVLLFNTKSLSDVGCTFRLMHRNVYESIRPHFSIGSSHFGVEMMLIIFMRGYRTIEISVNYLERVGMSSVTGDLRKAFVLGMTMIFYTLRFYILHRVLKHDIPHIPTGLITGKKGF